MMANAVVPPGPTEEMATRLMAAITSACDAFMAKSSGRRRRCVVYWWTNEIADLRHSCLRARRLAQRARGQPNEDACRASYASARRLLHAAIKTSRLDAGKHHQAHARGCFLRSLSHFKTERRKNGQKGKIRRCGSKKTPPHPSLHEAHNANPSNPVK
uniref:Uncharacterized protein n=1 Tax=Trichogramma kaykai TaxID=54128 RepID=A0ABD2WUJ5_9HYME